MDEDVKALAEILTNKLRPQSESSLTIKWAAVIGIFVLVFGSLFTGFVVNRSDISVLKTQQQHTMAAVSEIKLAQEKTLTYVTAIREDQIRRSAGGK